jgi:hypothetical protein
VPRREREQVARDLKPIYTAVDADAAQSELERFDEKWGARLITETLVSWSMVIPQGLKPAVTVAGLRRHPVRWVASHVWPSITYTRLPTNGLPRFTLVA